METHCVLQVRRTVPDKRYVTGMYWFQLVNIGSLQEIYVNMYLMYISFKVHIVSFQELKAKVLQLILIPCFAVSFQRGETVALIGSEPAPEQDSKDNVVSVFISEVSDCHSVKMFIFISYKYI